MNIRNIKLFNVIKILFKKLIHGNMIKLYYLYFTKFAMNDCLGDQTTFSFCFVNFSYHIILKISAFVEIIIP